MRKDTRLQIYLKVLKKMKIHLKLLIIKNKVNKKNQFI